MTLKKVNRKEVIFAQGDFGDTFFAVLRGKVALHIDGNLITTLGSGKCFGEGAIMSQQGQTRGGTLTALVECEFAMLTEAVSIKIRCPSPM